MSGIKVRDWLLAGGLTALGVVLMLENIVVSDAEVARDIAEDTMAHAMSSHSWWMLPVFAAATIPVLWWRRSVLAVTGITLAVMVLHDLMFGWVTRCGAALPLAFVLAFLGALVYDRAKAWLACGLVVLLTVAAVAVDASAGPDAAVLGVPVLLIVFGIGRAARHRTV